MSKQTLFQQRRNLLGCAVALLGANVQAHTPVLPRVEVWKTPTCGCCKLWVKHLEREGFIVKSYDVQQTASIRAKWSMPENMGSCHTAVVEGLVLEGHVPAREVRRLLAESAAFKAQVAGLSVPAMPIGSPGMEQGSRRDPYSVMLVNKNGTSRVYQTYSSIS